MKTKFKQRDIAWASVGVNYAIDRSRWDPLVDPEELLICSLGDLYEDPRLFSIVLAWAGDYNDFLHVERLGAYLADLDPFELAILGALAQKLESVDVRWMKLKKKVEKKIGRKRSRFESKSVFEKLAKVSGEDPDLKDFGVLMPVVNPADGKKLKPPEVIAAHNHWFKLRLLMNNHMRADSAVAIFLLGIENGYKLQKRIRCSLETAYRQFKELQNPVVEKQILLLSEAG